MCETRLAVGPHWERRTMAERGWSPEEGYMNHKQSLRDDEVFTEIHVESAKNWKTYVNEMYGKQGDNRRTVPTLHIRLADSRYSSSVSYLLHRQRCLVPRHYRWDVGLNKYTKYDILVIPFVRNVQRNMDRFENEWCAWFVTEDGYNVPILYWEFNRLKLSWPWRQKGPGAIKLWDTPEASCAYEDDYRLFADQDKKNPAVVSLFCGSRLICDTSTEPLDVLFNFYRNVKGVRAAVHNLVMMRMEHEYADTLERFMLLRKDIWQFFGEAISRFDETKQASRHKMFGEFRCFLDQEQERFKETFKG